jgi:hypothetical protein
MYAVTMETIDHNTLAHLVEAHAVRAAHVVGQPGGWGIVVKYGATERPLAATRSREVRVFKKLETLVGYLKDIGINQFDVDAVNFDPQGTPSYSRPDASAALKHAHAAAAHDKWFREQVTQAIKEADDPATQWVSNDVVKAESAKRRAAWRKRATAQARGKGVSGGVA